jgi:hypothetical protein
VYFDTLDLSVILTFDLWRLYENRWICIRHRIDGEDMKTIAWILSELWHVKFSKMAYLSSLRNQLLWQYTKTGKPILTKLIVFHLDTNPYQLLEFQSNRFSTVDARVHTGRQIETLKLKRNRSTYLRKRYRISQVKNGTDQHTLRNFFAK